ncbi:hypothetical protein OF83DRAFT_1083110 [Amylostereum chailletii]|nr:hypothetical protein OF83DRAFT_1083110 [Amylostereum chailletii]
MSKSASPTHPTQTSPRRSTGEKHSSGGKPQSDDRHATRGGHVPASTVSTSIPRVNIISTPTANGHTERERPNGRAKRGDRVEPKAAPEDPYPGLRALLRRTQDDLANITSDLDASNEAVRRLSDDRRAVERQITEVARLAIRFNETIGQKIPSCIMQPLLFAPGTDFDASTMTSEFNEGRDVGERAEARVICTTALGLRRAAEGVDQVLVKPQVVLRVDSPRQGHTS